MSWKKALFLGGAVLLLAACSDATAPNSLSRNGSKAGAAKLTAGSDSTITASQLEELLTDSPECRSGYYVRSGDRDICIDVIEIP